MLRLRLLLCWIEQSRADEAELRLGEIGKKSELRISELENKVSQLSDMVGNYEKLRYTDQQNIQKLKDRVTQVRCQLWTSIHYYIILYYMPI